MSEANCIFCKILKGEIPSYKVWENDKYLAILDIFPNTKGQTLVIPKQHLISYPFDIPKNDYHEAFEAAREVGKLLEEKLDVKRVALIVEGMGVDHLHIKLYPLHGLEKTFQETWTKDQVYFDQYSGYITTQLGPKAENSELQLVAETITS